MKLMLETVDAIMQLPFRRHHLATFSFVWCESSLLIAGVSVLLTDRVLSINFP